MDIFKLIQMLRLSAEANVITYRFDVFLIFAYAYPFLVQLHRSSKLSIFILISIKIFIYTELFAAK